jgi:glutamyl-tRNA reductase
MSQIVATADSPHRRDAADIIRRLGGRTDAALRRELDHFFAARPGLSQADRAAIVRAMLRFRNHLLHHPRITLRTAVADPARAHTWLNAVRLLVGLAADPLSKRAALRAPEHRAPIESTESY